MERLVFLFLAPTVMPGLRTSDIFKKPYKIQFWSYKKKVPGFEEISIYRILENHVKNREDF